MLRKLLLLVLCIAAALAVWHLSAIPSSDPEYKVESPTIPDTITIGWVGDMVPSDDIGYNITALNNNVSDALEQPDLMIGNLEGTFAHEDRKTKCVYISSQCHAFRGDSSFADTLKAAGFDFVSLINNHSYDYGTDGLKDTEAELDRVGLVYIAPDKPTASITIKGTKIGIMGLSSTEPTETISDYAYIAATVEALKKENDIVVVIFHGGAEGATKTKVTGATEYMGTENRGNVQAVAHTAINAGADLVLGAGPHVLRKTELFNNKPIAYSLGNFVGGKGRLSTTGVLALSGIFTTTFEQKVPTDTSFTSVILSKDGIPSLDPTDQAKTLLDSLSK
ncbi:MAG: capsule biosynthesis protein CapA [Candidatus Nomurabacteria bacterium]|nr:capsule biosynthesis protein CapA [Candidatus Nomurabacteria bacterium]